MKIKIEKGVSLVQSKRPDTHVGKWDFLSSLEVGDSFVLPDGISIDAFYTSSSRRIRKGLKSKFATRTIGDQVRVWRVE